MTKDDKDEALQIERLQALVQRLDLVVPSPLTTTLVQAGQVWRVRWDDLVSLVFIDSVLDGAEHRVRIAPLTIGSGDADDTAIILPAELSALAEPLSIWPELAGDVAEIVLEHWVSVIEGFTSLGAIEAAAERGELHRGLPVLNSSSPRKHEKHLLTLVMQFLTTAGSIARGSGGLDILLKGLSITAIAAALESDVSLAMQVKRNVLFLTISQAEGLSAVAGSNPDDLLAANPVPPDGLLDAVTSLDCGIAIRRIASHRQTSESKEFANLTQSVFALAARGEKASQTDWQGRVNTYVQMALS